MQVGGQIIVRALETVTHVDGDRFHAVYRKYGDLGAAAEELLLSTKITSKNLSLADIAARLDALATARTQAAKSAQLVDVLRSLSPLEAKYLIKLMTGDMRTGVKQSLVEEAIAAATDREVAAVRHAGMLLGDLAQVVDLARHDTLSTARFQMFHPLGFMLATPAANAEEAYARFAAEVSDELAKTDEPATAASTDPSGIAEESASAGPLQSSPQTKFSAQIEDKYDGMRAQVHCGDPAAARSRPHLLPHPRGRHCQLSRVGRMVFRRENSSHPRRRNPCVGLQCRSRSPVYCAAAATQPQTCHRRHAHRSALSSSWPSTCF